MRVAVLFDHIDRVVGFDERAHALGKRKGAHPHGIEMNALRGQGIERLGHCGTGGAEVQHAQPGGLRRWLHHRLRSDAGSGFQLFEQALHVVDVIFAALGIDSMGVARGAAREVAAPGGVGARQRAPRNAVAVHILVAGKFLAGIELGGAHDLAAVIFTRIVPLERLAQMLVHADIQVAHHEYRGLKTLGQIQRGGGMLEAFGGVMREQQDVLGVAVRGVGAG